jgi:hypothetical protein
MLLTKAEQRRRLLWPIKTGVHTLHEVAALLAEGKSWREIAMLWGLRRLRGADDLYQDVYWAWERAGGPGGPTEEPSSADGYLTPEWDTWRSANRTAIDAWLQGLAGKTTLTLDRTPDGHPQVWLLYRPEPFVPWSDDDRSIHLWVRRCDVFTSRVVAIAFLDNLLGYQVTWQPYNEAFPELWIGWARGDRWLLCPSPVDPPGGQR